MSDTPAVAATAGNISVPIDVAQKTTQTLETALTGGAITTGSGTTMFNNNSPVLPKQNNLIVYIIGGAVILITVALVYKAVKK
jgi:hypothetical protein